jgi:hypothetical protein
LLTFGKSHFIVVCTIYGRFTEREDYLALLPKKMVLVLICPLLIFQEDFCRLLDLLRPWWLLLTFGKSHFIAACTIYGLFTEREGYLALLPKKNGFGFNLSPICLSGGLLSFAGPSEI